MIRLDFHITPGDKTLASVRIPEKWEELTANQFIEIAGILYLPCDDTEKKVRICQLLLQEYFSLRRIDADVVEHNLLPLVDWVAEECNIVAQLIPRIKAGGYTFYGPSSEMDNLIAVEFDFSERAMQAWFECDPADTEQRLQLLYQFVACIYRPKKWKYYFINPKGADVRQAFNDSRIEYMANKMRKHVPVKVAFAVLLWYRACRNLWKEAYPQTFMSPGSSSGDTPLQPGYFSLMRMIAEKGIYGDFEKVEQMFVCNMLNEMEYSIEEHIRTKKRMEEMSEH